MKKKEIILSIILGVLSITFIVLGVLLFNSVPNTTTNTPIEATKVFGSIFSILIGLGCLLGSLIYIFGNGE